MNNNSHYKSEILFKDACYAAEQVVHLDLEELDKLSLASHGYSTALRTGIDCARLFKLGEHNHYNGLIYSIVQHLIRKTAPR